MRIALGSDGAVRHPLWRAVPGRVKREAHRIVGVPLGE